MPCVTVPLNLLETGGTSVRRVRLPVKACRRPSNYLAPSFLLLRFKDFASNHEHGRVKSFASQRAIGERHSLHLRGTIVSRVDCLKAKIPLRQPFLLVSGSCIGLTTFVKTCYKGEVPMPIEVVAYPSRIASPVSEKNSRSRVHNSPTADR